jgi:hypothetical protein
MHHHASLKATMVSPPTKERVQELGISPGLYRMTFDADGWVSGIIPVKDLVFDKVKCLSITSAPAKPEPQNAHETKGGRK